MAQFNGVRVSLSAELAANRTVYEVLLDGTEKLCVQPSRKEKLDADVRRVVSELMQQQQFSRDGNTAFAGDVSVNHSSRQKDLQDMLTSTEITNVRNSLRGAVTELEVLMDVMRLSKLTPYLVLDSLPKEPALLNPTQEIVVKKKSLAAAGKILKTAVERFRTARQQQTASRHQEYMNALLRLSKMFALRRPPDSTLLTIIGDLALPHSMLFLSSANRAAKSFANSQQFEVRPVRSSETTGLTKRSKDAVKLVADDADESTWPVAVVLPADLREVSYSGLKFELVNDNPYVPAEVSPITCFVQIPDIFMLSNMNEIRPWERRLLNAQMTLICRQLLTTITGQLHQWHNEHSATNSAYELFSRAYPFVCDADSVSIGFLENYRLLVSLSNDKIPSDSQQQSKNLLEQMLSFIINRYVLQERRNLIGQPVVGVCVDGRRLQEHFDAILKGKVTRQWIHAGAGEQRLKPISLTGSLLDFFQHVIIRQRVMRLMKSIRHLPDMQIAVRRVLSSNHADEIFIGFQARSTESYFTPAVSNVLGPNQQQSILVADVRFRLCLRGNMCTAILEDAEQQQQHGRAPLAARLQFPFPYDSSLMELWIRSVLARYRSSLIIALAAQYRWTCTTTLVPSQTFSSPASAAEALCQNSTELTGLFYDVFLVLVKTTVVRAPAHARMHNQQVVTSSELQIKVLLSGENYVWDYGQKRAATGNAQQEQAMRDDVECQSYSLKAIKARLSAP